MKRRKKKQEQQIEISNENQEEELPIPIFPENIIPPRPQVRPPLYMNCEGSAEDQVYEEMGCQGTQTIKNQIVTILSNLYSYSIDLIDLS